LVKQTLSKAIAKRQDPNQYRILHPSWNADRQQPYFFDVESLFFAVFAYFAP
jgi:hypothetical protein